MLIMVLTALAVLWHDSLQRACGKHDPGYDKLTDETFMLAKEKMRGKDFRVTPRDPSKVCVFADHATKISINNQIITLPYLIETYRCYLVPIERNTKRIEIVGLRTANPSGKIILWFGDEPLSPDHECWWMHIHWCSKYAVAVAVGETIYVDIARPVYTKKELAEWPELLH